MPARLQQLRGPVVIWAVAALAAMSATDMLEPTAIPEVQRIQIRRVQRRRPGGLLKLGDPPWSEEMPAPGHADHIVLNNLTGVADVALVHPMVHTELSEVKLAYAENASSITAVQQRSVSEVFLRDIQDLFYLLPVNLGTPRRSAVMLLDTGSSDLWVENGDGHDNQDTYSTGASTSFHSQPSLTYQIKYGKGEVAGFAGTDNFCLQSICIDQEPFIVADLVKGIGNDGFFHGLLGLAFPSLAECEDCSFVHQVIKSNKYESFAFGLLLGHDDQDSYVEFGELDMLKSEAKDTHVDGVTVGLYGVGGKATYWMTKPEEIHVGKHTISTTDIFTILDCGTSLMTVPEDQYNVIWPLLSEESDDAFPDAGCSDTVEGAHGMMLCVCGKTNLNPLSFVYRDVSGKTSMKITLGQDELLPPEAVATLTDTNGSLKELCRPSLTVGPKGMQFWLLGDTFMRRVYTIHDVKNLKLHLYQSSVGSPGPGSRFPSSAISRLREPSTIEYFLNRLWFFANVLVVTGSFFVVLRLAGRCCGIWKGWQAREDAYSQLLS